MSTSPNIILSPENTSLTLPPDYESLTITQLHLMTLVSQTSRRTRTSIFNSIAKIFGADDHLSLDWLALKPTDMSVLVAILMESKKLRPATVNNYISALRSLYYTAYINGFIDHETYQRKRAIKNVEATRVTRNRELVKKNELRDLIDYCESLQSPAGIRDAAIISILSSCGLRRAELASLTMESYLSDEQIFCVIGKGNKERFVPIPQSTAGRIDKWLDFFRGYKDGYLFCRVRRHNFISDDYKSPLSGNAIYDILKNRTTEINAKQVRPHGLRHYCGTTLLNAGNDLVLVRDYLGHQSISTTQIYIEKDQSELHNAATIFD